MAFGINCAERGLLLLRVRDEIRMTIASLPDPVRVVDRVRRVGIVRKALQAEATGRIRRARRSDGEAGLLLDVHVAHGLVLAVAV